MLDKGVSAWALLSSSWVEVDPGEVCDGSGRRLSASDFEKMFPKAGLPPMGAPDGSLRPPGPARKSGDGVATPQIPEQQPLTTASLPSSHRPQFEITEQMAQKWRRSARIDLGLKVALILIALAVVLFSGLPAQLFPRCEDCEWNARR